MTKSTTDIPILDDDAVAEIEARASAASAGPWKVYKTPFTLTELGRQQGFKEDRKSVVNAIGQTWDHPQLKGPMAIVTTTHGPYYDPQHAVKIEDEDAEFIAHAREDIPALCQTVRVLRAELRYRSDALEEMRRYRDRWLTMLNPASADETVDGAIRNLQQAYISERDNAADLQSQLEQVTKERGTAHEVATAITIGKQKAEQIAASMRSACIEKVKAMATKKWNKQYETEGQASALLRAEADALNEAANELESVSIQEQEKR